MAVNQNKRNLHSTMLLLYRRWDNYHGRQSNIYIPLCFYFIYHADSDLQESAVYLHSTMLLLYPCRMSGGMTAILHLHSTMLLLYQNTRQLPPYAAQIYIPLCFYFIRNPLSSIRVCVEFTFHYASTLSEIGSVRTNGKYIYIPLCFYFIVNYSKSCN